MDICGVGPCDNVGREEKGVCWYSSSIKGLVVTQQSATGFSVVVAPWCPQSTGRGLEGDFEVMEADAPVEMSRGVEWWLGGKCAGGNHAQMSG